MIKDVIMHENAIGGSMANDLVPAPAFAQVRARILSDSDLPPATPPPSPLKVKDLLFEGEQWVLSFNDKGGKHRKVPVRHDLQFVLHDYMNAAGIEASDKNAPLFRTAVGKRKELSTADLTDNDTQRMFKRRILRAGLTGALSPHSLRVTTITTLLEQGVALEDVQNLANHTDLRTTRLYDRRKRKITRNIVERIPVYADVEK
jgi:integrase/recombinase XerD